MMEPILKLIKDHEVNLKEESVCFSFQDGFISASLEEGKLDVKVEFVDKVIHIQESIENIFKTEEEK